MQYYLVLSDLQRHVRQTMQYVVLLTGVDMHQNMFIYRLYNKDYYRLFEIIYWPAHDEILVLIAYSPYLH